MQKSLALRVRGMENTGMTEQELAFLMDVVCSDEKAFEELKQKYPSPYMKSITALPTQQLRALLQDIHNLKKRLEIYE